VSRSLESQSPKQFGRYEVEGLIGDGAMGRVYRGFDPLVRRAVAIKTFKADGIDPKTAEDLVRRFSREAQLAGALSHPHIVSIFDVGEDYFVMEFLEGKTLLDLIEERGSLPADEALLLFAPIADALDYAHRKGVIHRDIKPGNIMVLPDGRPKLMDFGVAHMESSNITKAGEVLGSPSYMAPEQIAGEEITKRADLFSLGTVAYQTLTGQKPFQGSTVTTVIYRVVHEDPPPPRKWNEELPVHYDAVFRKALSKSPSGRYATALEFTAALDLRAFDLDADAAFPAPSGRGPAPTRERAIATSGGGATGKALWTGAAVVAALAIAGGLWLARRPAAAPDTPPTPAPALLTGLRIETDPPGATVAIDGKEVGVSPLALPAVAPGVRSVRVARPGYAPAQLSLEIVADVPLAPLRFSLQPTEGRAAVASDPTGATLFVDGHDAGKTPKSDLTLLPGPHNVRIEAPGYQPWRRRIEAKAGETVSVEARLVAVPAEQKPSPEPEPTPPPLKEGDLVELGADVTPPRKISGETAAYPARAQKSRMQGLVVVEMIVTETGEPIDLRIVESAGEILDRAVLDAVKTWRFEPARKEGLKVRVLWPVRQRFEISR
jgi:eukaryotic-like serine/threonine-protein kinase